MPMKLLKDIKEAFLASAVANIIPVLMLLLLLNLGLSFMGEHGYILPRTIQSLVNALSLTIGLLLAFRNNCSYERYWEGRILWCRIHMHSRNIARIIALYITTKTEKDNEEKIDCLGKLINLCYFIKDDLRKDANKAHENSIGQWIRELNGPRIVTDNENDFKLQVEKSKALGRVASASPSNKDEEQTEKGLHKTKLKRERTNDDANALGVYFMIEKYIQKNIMQKSIDQNLAALISSALSEITKANLNCQRIARTPIAPAYSIYLNISVVLYCVSLTLYISTTVSYSSILETLVFSFVILGLHNIGIELENPFGYQYNDLPLEQYCKNIKNDIEEIIESTVLNKSYVFYLA